MLARIVTVVCIAYLCISQAPPSVQLRVDASIAMLTAPPGTCEAVAAATFTADA